MGKVSFPTFLFCYFPQSTAVGGIGLIYTVFLLRGYSFFCVLLSAAVLQLIIVMVLNRISRRVKWNRTENKREAICVLLYIAIILFILLRCIQVIVLPFHHSMNLSNKKMPLEGKVLTKPVIHGSQKRGEMIIQTAYGKIRLFNDGELLECGDYFSATISLENIPGARNPGGFDTRNYDHRRGIFLHGSVVQGSLEMIDKPPDWFFRLCFRLRSRIINGFFAVMPYDDAALLSGFVLGEKSFIHHEIAEKLRRSGISHLTAVSGTAISCLYTPIAYLAGLFKWRRKFRIAFIVAVLTGLGCITCWTASVSRSLLMLFSAMLSKFFYKKVTAFQTLSIAIFMMITLHPLTALSAGFYFSVFATCGILRLREPFAEWIQKKIFMPDWFISGVSISMAASIGIIPAMYLFSDEISLVGCIANIFAVPFAHAAILIGFLMGMIELVFPQCFMTMLLAYPAKGALGLIMMIVNIFSAADFSAFRTLKVSLGLAVISLAISIILLFPKFMTKKRFLIFLSISVISLIIYPPILYILKPDMSIVFIDVGQGDATLITLKSGPSVLIDAGGKKRGAVEVKNVLDYYGIRYPSVYIATHTHEDHCGGMPELFKSRGGKVLILPIYTLSQIEEEQSLWKESDIKEMIFSEAVANKISIRYAGDQDCVRLNEHMCIVMLNPPYDQPPETDPSQPSDANEISLVLLIKYNEHKVLIMGDAVDDTEKRIALTKPDIRGSIFRVSHHGSPNGTNHDIISAVNPAVSVISVGYNSYGHPSPKVIDRLQKAGSCVLRTDQQGAVLIDYYGKKAVIRSMLKGNLPNG